ncbi:LOW QUALITY PROTEIN: clusterin-like protein 1 [Rhineura floridana]|uniref:LOW QUALITY PROTEIN: clusterin-like protein 1 n=1 Tax=Rhineura floridana TaxID=261503 RepID=UPI002AC7F533|nr:LOW QUALITY PROTEIN: clusterin-like protein 1 [Rhineura floridana]
MKPLLVFIMYLLWLRGHRCAPTKEEDIHFVENLKILSEVGEKYVDEDVKKALTGIKQMKIMMERNEVKYMDLMKTLKKSSEEKERSLKNLWEECKSCLESNCMRFYTTCQHGLSTFTSKVEDFFRRTIPLSFPVYEVQAQDLQFNQKPEKEDAQLVQMEHLFNQLLFDMGTIFKKSFVFFKQMQKEFDQSFQIYFMSDPDLTEPYFLPAFPEESVRNTGSPKDWEAPGFLQLVFDFSRTVLEGVGEVITEVFEGYRETARDMAEQLKDSDRSGMFSKSTPGHERTCNMLHQNSSGCPHFHERCQKCQDNFMQVCPSVPELHIKCDDAFKLVNISGEMYQQILQIVKCHTEDTSYVLNKMKERFGWVSELSNMIIGPENIFNIVKVSSSAKGGDASSLNETVVDVNILTSPTFTIKVPQDLDTESSEFIEYVAGKALQFYKKNF